MYFQRSRTFWRKLAALDHLDLPAWHATSDYIDGGIFYGTQTLRKRNTCFTVNIVIYNSTTVPGAEQVSSCYRLVWLDHTK